MSAALLPAVPALPHDPLSLVLSGRTGFRLATLDQVEVSPGHCGLGGALSLARLPEATRFLSDEIGAFGGWTLPYWAAISGAGEILLLDWQRGVLRGFDACECRFRDLACTLGVGADPGGIAISCKHLYVCDGANRRLCVFGERDLVLRALWSSPASLAVPWQPLDVAVRANAEVAITDPANGALHILDARGHLLRTFSGLGAVRHVAFDCDDRLFVSLQGEPKTLVLDPESGVVVATLSRANEAIGRFLPLAVDVGGEGELGIECDGVRSVFDLHGELVDAELEPAQASFVLTGTAFTSALDSKLYRCLWDRLIFEGDFPEETRVRVSAFSAETELPQELVEALPESAWSTCPTLEGKASAPWDCLLRAAAGRFLWLRLELWGNGHATPRIERLEVVFPRVSLRRYLPAVFGSDPVSADFTDRLLAVFDREFRAIERTIDHQAALFDPLSAPSDDPDPERDFLSWLATWIGVSLDRGWPEERRRQYLKSVGRLLPLRGTLEGFERHLLLYLGLDAHGCRPLPACHPCDQPEPRTCPTPKLVLEHFRLRNWLFLCGGRLGAQSRVWGERLIGRTKLNDTAQLGVTKLDVTHDPFRDPFHLYAHKLSVFAPACLGRTPGAKRGLERLIAAEKPAHTHCQVVWVEPRFRIGIQSMIGFDSAIGRYPSGSRLAQMQLGRGTLLAPTRMAEQQPAIGKQTTIGTTTRLD